MATQIVMDRTGDTRNEFDANDQVALLRAEKRFKQLTTVGFTAAVRTASGEVTLQRSIRLRKKQAGEGSVREEGQGTAEVSLRRTLTFAGGGGSSRLGEA